MFPTIIYPLFVYQDILSSGTCSHTLTKSRQPPKPCNPRCVRLSAIALNRYKHVSFANHHKNKRTCSKSSDFCINRPKRVSFWRQPIRILYLTCSILAPPESWNETCTKTSCISRIEHVDGATCWPSPGPPTGAAPGPFVRSSGRTCDRQQQTPPGGRRGGGGLALVQVAPLHGPAAWPRCMALAPWRWFGGLVGQ